MNMVTDAEIVDRLFEKCRIVFFFDDLQYPIEHNPHANKISKQEIIEECIKQIVKEREDG